MHSSRSVWLTIVHSLSLSLSHFFSFSPSSKEEKRGEERTLPFCSLCMLNLSSNCTNVCIRMRQTERTMDKYRIACSNTNRERKEKRFFFDYSECWLRERNLLSFRLNGRSSSSSSSSSTMTRSTKSHRSDICSLRKKDESVGADCLSSPLSIEQVSRTTPGGRD